jgi:hypothetical protein
MAQTASGSSGSSGPDESSGERLPAIFIGIVLVEALTIAGLYWFGVHFA